MYLSQLLADVNIIDKYNYSDMQITGVHYNSAKIQPGNIFIAIRGYSTDGHKYIPSAVTNGAVAVVCEEYCPDCPVAQIVVDDSRVAQALVCANFFGRPSGKFKLIGITGTNGKTTCTYLVKKILDTAGCKVGLIGTNQNMIGDKVFETGRTTPDAFELQELFARMAQEGVDYVVMEVSSHALELSRVYGCRFEVGAFTNLTQDHLDFHKTMDAYADAKSQLFSMSRRAVINCDDKYGAAFAAKFGAKGYGIDSHCAYRAVDTEYTPSGVSFYMDGHRYSLNIPGRFSVYNALCAIGICIECGIEPELISRALAGAEGVKGRAEVVATDTDYTVMIDYAHTPDGIENILRTVRGFAKGRVVVLFGCGGDRDNTKRPIMGRVAGELADFCIITSDNPRTEDPMGIIAMIEPGVKETRTPYVVIENRAEAIAYALDNAQTDDVIVLAGKGHETYQVLNSGTVDFDEREIVKKHLEK